MYLKMHSNKIYYKTNWFRFSIGSIGLIIILLITLLNYYATKSLRQCESPVTDESKLRRPFVSSSIMGIYSQQAVATESTICADIGNSMLTINGGNAVDAALASTVCLGVLVPSTSGIGGGSFVLIYNKTQDKVFSLDFREKAPKRANETMFAKLPRGANLFGGMAIAVPGEVAGLYATWKRFGSLSWKTLWQPSIQLLRVGVPVTEYFANVLQQTNETLKKSPFFQRFINHESGQWLQTNEIFRDDELANTFERIADNPTDFYNGSLSKDIVNEVRQAGGIISAEDLSTYEVSWRNPIQAVIQNGEQIIYSLPPPCSGAILTLISQIMDGYNINPRIFSNFHQATLYFHRLIESFKFAFVQRSFLGDEDFVNISGLINNLQSRSFADSIRSKINDLHTQNIEKYEVKFSTQNDHGTAQTSVVDKQGNAVALTSTINFRFGALVRGNKTGIYYNNEMGDFSQPNVSTVIGYPPAAANFIVPGKKPMSSMTPVIVINKRRQVTHVMGGAGGVRITTSVIKALLDQIYLNMTIKEAIDYPRFHYLIDEQILEVSPNFPIKILNALKGMGHTIRIRSQASTLNGIRVGDRGQISANCDSVRHCDTRGL